MGWLYPRVWDTGQGMLDLSLHYLSVASRSRRWLGLRKKSVLAGALVSVVSGGLAEPSWGEVFADWVVSFESGTTAAETFTGEPFNQKDKALGAPEAFTGEQSDFAGVVSPFNPPFSTDELVSIGEGGHITLRLARFAMVGDSGLHIGVFTNAGLVETDFPHGQAADELVANDGGVSTFGMDAASVEVSEDGVHFIALNNGEPILFDIPTNGYTDVTNPFDTEPGSSLTDPSKPWSGGLSAFDGLNYAAIVTLLDGSAGGKWLDLSGTGLDQVGYIRFSVADDGDDETRLNFEIDAVSVAQGFLGAPVPLPTSSFLFIGAGGLMMIQTKRGARSCGVREKEKTESTGPDHQGPSGRLGLGARKR